MASTAPTVDLQESDWKLIAATLSRKTSEQISLWIDRYDRGVITTSTMIGIVSALYDATSGFVEKDVSDLLADLHKDLVRQAQQKT